jgi:hypothetical protein
MNTITSVGLPAESRIGSFYPTTNLADAFSIDLPERTITDPEQLARFVFEQQPAWVAGLMALRDAIVAGFGLKTSNQLKRLDAHSGTRRVHIFKIYETSEHEIILGEDDKHLDFRLSGLYRPQSKTASGAPRLVLSTVVKCHNVLGRTYILLIAPFHRLVVQASLRRAARMGWPVQA